MSVNTCCFTWQTILKIFQYLNYKRSTVIFIVMYISSFCGIFFILFRIMIYLAFKSARCFFVFSPINVTNRCHFSYLHLQLWGLHLTDLCHHSLHHLSMTTFQMYTSTICLFGVVNRSSSAQSLHKLHALTFIFVYLSGFSGSGDGFFSSAFQSRLEGNELYNANMPHGKHLSHSCCYYSSPVLSVSRFHSQSSFSSFSVQLYLCPLHVVLCDISQQSHY